MGVLSSESHDLTAFYEMLTASFGVLSQNTGFYPSLDRIVETMLGPLNLGPGGGSYNKPISHLHRPLYALTCKTQWWVWGSPEQKVFDALKKAVTSAPVLTFPSQSSHFRLECDASNFVTGVVLSQVQADGMHQPIAFMSKGFSDVECNYQIHDKEMLAIMHALDEWGHCLEGVTEKSKILMDHWNLTSF